MKGCAPAALPRATPCTSSRASASRLGLTAPRSLSLSRRKPDPAAEASALRPARAPPAASAPEAARAADPVIAPPAPGPGSPSGSSGPGRVIPGLGGGEGRGGEGRGPTEPASRRPSSPHRPAAGALSASASGDRGSLPGKGRGGGPRWRLICALELAVDFSAWLVRLAALSVTCLRRRSARARRNLGRSGVSEALRGL